MTELEVFMKKVQHGGGPDGTCWLWTGTLSRGYGYFWHAPTRKVAHRYLYEVMVGPVPEGLQLDHLCRVRNCVNPEHLEPVTRRENIMRGESPIARNARKSECAQGHEFSTENTRIRPDGVRICRTCEREAHNAWRKKNKERGLTVDGKRPRGRWKPTPREPYSWLPSR